MKTTESTMSTYPTFVAILYENLDKLVLLNLLFLICSLPVVTLPAAYTALTMCMQKLVRADVLHARSDFFQTFRKSLFRSLPVGLMAFGLPFLCSYTVPFYRELLSQSAMFYIPLVICCSCAGIGLMAGFYAFPMLAAVELPLGGVFRNALALVFIRLGQSLLGAAVLAVITLVVVLTFPVSLILLATVYFSLFCAVATFTGWGGILDYVLKQ